MGGFIGGGCVKNSQGAEECQTCRYKSCGKACYKNHGACNRNNGKCVCATTNTYNGKNCLNTCRTEKREVDWSRSFDKWGWSVCPSNYGQGSHNPANQHPGELMIGFTTDGKGDALYNIERGYCARPMYGAKDS